MNRAEVAQLLAMASTYDKRTVGDADVIGWHAILEPVSFEDARLALLAHFGRSTDWMMPAHIVRGVERLHAVRLEAAGDALRDGTDDLEGSEFLRRLRANRERIVGGGSPGLEAGDPA